MADEQPYNSLGQILASGGEIAVGLALYHGWDSNRLALLLGRRLRVAPGSDTDELIRIAEDAIASGEYLNSLTPDDIIDPGQIVTNPVLFGDDPQGRRWRWEGEYRFGPDGTWWRYGGGEADFEQLKDILGQISQSAVANANTYKAKEGVAGDISSMEPEIRFTLALKRF